MTIRKTIADKIFKKVCEKFEYVPDEMEDYACVGEWTSYADDVNEGNIFESDIDNFAFTCADMLISAGLKENEVMVVTCNDEDGLSHVVCAVEDIDNGLVWALDNRSNCVYDWKRTKFLFGEHYDWKHYSKMDDFGTWHEVVQS